MAEMNPLSATPAATTQRMNTDEATSFLIQDFRNTLSQLSQLWDQVHLDANMRGFRVQQACEFIRNLLRDIVTHEEQQVRTLPFDIEARQKAVTELRKLFNQPPFDESLYPSGSIALLKALDNEMIRLAEKREYMIGKQKELLDKYEHCCKRLGIRPDEFEEIQERIFTETELNSLKGKYIELKNTFNKRLDKALQLQHENNKVYESVQLPTSNSLGEDDLQCLRMDLNSTGIVLSDELLNRMTMLNQRLKDYYDSWIEQVAFRYDELLVKLDDLASKCFRQPVSHDHPAGINYERLNERELQKLEEELREKQELYDRAQPVFDKLNEWLCAWKEKLDTERRVCRASFYKNRAGSLNQKLKQRRLLDQKVPKLFSELTELCEGYVKNYKVYDILVDGMRADKYAENVIESYERDREVQKAQKQLSAKVSQTPAGRTRNLFATSSTPSRSAMRQLNLPALVGTNPRKRSFSCSQLSAIHPLQSPIRGPLTSSPKPPESS